MNQAQGVYWGRAEEDGRENRQWLVGHFKPEDSPLHDNNISIRPGRFLKGEARTLDNASADPKNRAICILISGKTTFRFYQGEDQPWLEIPLVDEFDYVIWEPGVLHSWEAIEDSTTIGINWPAESKTAEEPSHEK